MNIKFDSMYSFQYKPIGIGKLHIYDANPLIFILDFNSKSMLGVNLHWVPLKYREEFVQEVEEIILKTKLPIQKKQRARLTYMLLKKPKYKLALSGIRRYIIKNIKSFKLVPKQNWKTALRIKQYRADIRLKVNNYKPNKR